MLLCYTALPSLKYLQPPVSSRCCHLYLAYCDLWGTGRANSLFKVTVLVAVWEQSSGVATCKLVSFLHAVLPLGDGDTALVLQLKNICFYRLQPFSPVPQDNTVLVT